MTFATCRRYVTPNLTAEGLQLTRDALRVLATVADTLVFMLVGLAIVVYNVHYTTSFSLFVVAFAGCIVVRSNPTPTAHSITHSSRHVPTACRVSAVARAQHFPARLLAQLLHRV